MKCARIAGVLVFVALSALPAAAQRGIPIVDLPPAAVKTSDTFGAVLGVRQLSGGTVLVNDAGRRQVRLFDPSLATSTVVLDSTAGTSTSYGRRPAPLLTYVGDSSLFPDYQSRTAVVLDERGRVARSLALPTITDIGLIRRGAAIDDRGRILFAGNAPRIPPSKEGETADLRRLAAHSARGSFTSSDRHRWSHRSTRGTDDRGDGRRERIDHHLDRRSTSHRRRLGGVE
jgi:hypothetical protein